MKNVGKRIKIYYLSLSNALKKKVNTRWGGTILQKIGDKLETEIPRVPSHAALKKKKIVYRMISVKRRYVTENTGQ